MNGQSVTKAFVPLPAGATAVYNSSGLARYRHSDWLGSSRIASTPAGALYYDGAYSPMGETILETGTTDRSFTGQNADLATDLYDFPAREYHPIHGRWISPDPAGLAAVNPANPQSWNRYAYVNGSPLNSVDPLGLDPITGYTPAPCNGRNACADYAVRSPVVGAGIYDFSLNGTSTAALYWQAVTATTTFTFTFGDVVTISDSSGDVFAWLSQANVTSQTTLSYSDPDFYSTPGPTPPPTMPTRADIVTRTKFGAWPASTVAVKRPFNLLCIPSGRSIKLRVQKRRCVALG